MMKNVIYILMILFFSACSDDFLETHNDNEPDLAIILQDPGQWESIVAKQFNVIWNASQNDEANITLGGMADVLTFYAGNFGLNYISEPREPIDNSGPDTFIEYSYHENFKVIGSVNDILRLLIERPNAIVENSLGEDIRDKLHSACYFLRGMAYGNLANRYDQVQYVTEDMDLTDAAQFLFEQYDIIIEKAIQDLQRAKETASVSGDFSIEYFHGNPLSKSEFIQFINTLQAKYLLHNSRNSGENEEVNKWDQILQYALNGIQFDVNLAGDGGNEWYDTYKWHIGLGLALVDHRVISMMAEDVSPGYSGNGAVPLPEANAIDQRLVSDMQYTDDITQADRGLYLLSHYKYIRYSDYIIGFTGPMQWFLKAENDLMIAEALIRTDGDRKVAADLINTTRVGRGGLDSMTIDHTDNEFLDAIMHERFIELLGTNAGQPYYDRRRLPDDDGTVHPYKGLQPGTPHQFPVPFSELTLLGMEIYTFP